MQQERPPAYTNEPNTLHLPSVPRHDLPSIATATRHHLPGIKSLDLPTTTSSRTSAANAGHGSLDMSPKSHADPLQWHYIHPLSHTNFPQAPSTVPRNSTEVDIGSPMEVESVTSVDDQHTQKAASVISMDDPDVRLAAEALSGLGNPDFVRSPKRNLNLPRDTHEPEPLLSLLTSNHPWLGGTINGSISAYTTTKFYSPRFIQYGAELLERNIGSPVANTVSSVGRRTGVEKNLRRYLGGHRRHSDLEQGDDAADSPGYKRRRVMSSDAMDVEIGSRTPTPRTRGNSQGSYADTLPAYDDHRSPQYEETATTPSTAVVVVDPPPNQDQSRTQGSSQDRRVNWSTQLMITTSGLGAALSEGSLRSLKFCLGLLRSATQHVDTAMHALKLLLDDYEKAMRARQQEGSENTAPTTALTTTISNAPVDEKEEQVRALAARMKHLSDDIWQTLKTVVSSVSRYTGGALPENAGVLVRRQLLSVPQRWRAAGESTAGEEREGRAEEVRGAYRMLAFAREGLDMMAQVSTVVDGTIVSAETWLGRMGRRREEGVEGSAGKGEKEGLVGATGEQFGAGEKRGLEKSGF